MTQGYMGPNQANALTVGAQWQQIVGNRYAERATVRRRGDYGGGVYDGGNVVVRPEYGARPEHHRRHHHHHNRPPEVQYDARVGGWQMIVGGQAVPLMAGEAQALVGAGAMAVPGTIDGIPPRNALIDAPGPERAGREILPMSTGVAILTGQSAQITARPQRVAFRPERVFISASGTAGGAADWIINDIKIGNRSQFSQSGDVPGDMFANNAIDSFISFETAQTAMDVVLVVTYVGTNSSGAAFYGAVIGTAAI